MKLKTVTIDRDGSPVVINKSDFMPGMELWGQKAPEPEPNHEPEPEPEQDESAGDLKDQLIARLAAHGIEKDRRSSVSTLQSLVDDL